MAPPTLRHDVTKEPAMRPVVSTTVVDRPRDEVYAFLDVLGNHRAITDHVLVDWTLRGPAAGVGAAAQVRIAAPGPPIWGEMTVVAAEPGRSTTDETVWRTRVRTRGAYLLDDAPGGGTAVRFTFEVVEAAMPARLLLPLLRRSLQRGDDRALRRLAALLRPAPAGAS
jgi:hypothetical protein